MEIVFVIWRNFRGIKNKKNTSDVFHIETPLLQGIFSSWGRERDSTPQALRRRILSPLRLPIPPSRPACYCSQCWLLRQVSYNYLHSTRCFVIVGKRKKAYLSFLRDPPPVRRRRKESLLALFIHPS